MCQLPNAPVQSTCWDLHFKQQMVFFFGLPLSAKIPGQKACWALFLLQNSLWVHKCWGFGLWWEDTRSVLRWSPWWAAGDRNGLSSMVGTCQPSLGPRQHLWWSQHWRCPFCRHFLWDQSFFQSLQNLVQVFFYFIFGSTAQALSYWLCDPLSLGQLRFWCFRWFWGGVVSASARKNSKRATDLFCDHGLVLFTSMAVVGEMETWMCSESSFSTFSWQCLDFFPLMPLELCMALPNLLNWGSP